MKKGAKAARPKTNHDPKELLLSGRNLSDDEKISETVEYFKKELKDAPGIPVVLDLCSCKKIFSKGISVILGLYKECGVQKRPFRITLCSDELYSLFKLFKLDKAISIEKVTR